MYTSVQEQLDCILKLMNEVNITQNKMITSLNEKIKHFDDLLK